MKRGRGKTMAAGAVLLGVMTLLATGYVFRGTLVEETCIWQLRSVDESKREAAAAWLAERRSARAVPFLLKQADRDPFCLEAVKRSGRRAVPAIAAELRRRIGGGLDGLDVEGLAGALVYIGRTSTEAAGPLIELLEHSAAHVRVTAASALRRIGPRARKAVSTLIVRLGDQDEEVVRAAAEALGDIGPAARAAAPALFDLLRGEQHSSWARGALVAIGAGAAPFLATRLPDPATRPAVADIPEEIGPPAAPSLVKLLRDGDSGLRLTAADILSSSQVEADAVMPVLIEALKSPLQASRERAAVGLVRFHAKAAPFLGELLSSRETPVRIRAATILGWLGRDAGAAVPALEKALMDSEAEVRSAAARVLGEIGPSAVPALTACLEDRSPAVRSSAARALGRVKSP